MERTDRWLPLLGVVYVVLGVAGVVVAGSGQPTFPAEAEEAAQWFADDTGQVLASAVLWYLALIPLFFFLGVLRSRLRAVEGDDDRLAWTASTAGAAGVAVVAVAVSVQALGALRAQEDDGIPEGLAQLYADLANIVYGAGAPILLGIAVLAVAALTFRKGAPLPPWLAWITVLFALVAFIPPISWVFSFFLFNLWVLAVSILLFVDHDERQDEEMTGWLVVFRTRTRRPIA